MHLTLQQLRLFEAVARNRSFTRAAEELFLTQPAVSIQISRLEGGIGSPLFEQIGKRIYLTAAGREVCQTARDVLGRLEALEDALADLHGQIRGPLQLSVVTTGKYLLPHLLGAFVRKYPDVTPRLAVTNRAQVIERLRDNVDDMVVMGQVPQDLPVAARPFLEDVLVMVAHPEHPLAQEKHISLERLLAERFLVREPGSGTRMIMDHLFAERNLRIEPYMELGSSEAIKQGVEADLGISVLSLHSLHLELSGGYLVVLDVEQFPLKRQWYVVSLKGKRLSLAAQTFIDFLIAEAEAVLREHRNRTA
jgi:DNA-binding transcriptional LysR family regulator